MQLNEFENYLKLHVNSPKTIKEYVGRVRHFFNSYKEFNQENINEYLVDLINPEIVKKNVILSLNVNWNNFCEIVLINKLGKKINDEMICLDINYINDKENLKILFKQDFSKLRNVLRNTSNAKKSAFNLSVASFVKYAKFKKVVMEFPKHKKIASGKQSSLTWEEIEKEILPYFNDLFIDGQKRKTVFRFMVLTMLRVSEVVKLKKEWIDFDTGRIYPLGKGNKKRISYINEVIIPDVKKLVEQSKTDRAFDFNESYINYMFSKINNELDYKKKVSPHTTRRAGARFMIDNGLSIFDLKDILGHESLETTQRYVNYSEEETHKHYHNIEYKKG